MAIWSTAKQLQTVVFRVFRMSLNSNHIITVFILLKRIWQVSAVMTVLFFSLWGCSDSQVESRPSGKLLIDKADILADVAESVENHLHLIRDRYDVEVVLATVESTGAQETIQDLTARLFTQWDVGRKNEGRGLLLILSDSEKEVRIEVGLALEGVFTDFFTGYIENKQLKSYFLSNQLSLGLIAVLEEIEVRAELLSRGDASSERIDTMDMRFLSSGGGADLELESYRAERVVTAGSRYPAGGTPDQAWQTLIQSWRDKNRDPNMINSQKVDTKLRDG